MYVAQHAPSCFVVLSTLRRMVTCMLPRLPYLTRPSTLFAWQIMANGMHVVNGTVNVLNDGVFIQSAGELENAALFLFVNNTGLAGSGFTGTVLAMNGTQVRVPPPPSPLS